MIKGFEEKMQEKIELRYYLEAVLLSIVVLGITYSAIPAVFFINDDENILYTLAGYYTKGQPADHPFINIILSYVLRRLYDVFPMVSWYGLFHILIVFASLTIIFKCIIKNGQKNEVKETYIFFYNICFYCLVIIVPAVLLQFTTTSALAGTAAVVLILDIDINDGKKVKYFEYTVAYIFLLICYMHRKNTGNVIICFFVAMVGYKVIEGFLYHKEDKFFFKRILFLVCSLLSIVAVSYINKYSRNDVLWKQYEEYDTERYKVTDYPHDSIYDNPELYEEIGWTENLYNLAGGHMWFFMDERINADTFQKISETGYYASENKSMSMAFKVGRSLFVENRIARVCLCFTGILLCIITFLYIRRKNWFDLIFVWCISGGAFILSFYLCWIQRFPLRAFHTIILPTLAIYSAFLVKQLKFIEEWLGESKRYIRVLCTIIGIGVIIGVGGKVAKDVNYEASNRKEKSQRTLVVEQYALNNEENMYIYDISLTFRYLPFTVYENQYPSNVMFWGGMGWNSPAFYTQLVLNNLENLFSEAFFEDNVYYVTWEDYLILNEPIKELMFRYMSEKYPGVKMEKIDELEDNICVYKFTR